MAVVSAGPSAWMILDWYRVSAGRQQGRGIGSTPIRTAGGRTQNGASVLGFPAAYKWTAARRLANQMRNVRINSQLLTRS
jgi:hypothetical protein